MRKLILVLGIFVVLAGVGGSLLVNRFLGLWPWDLLTTGPLSKKQLEEKVGKFSRNHPEVIKGNWEPSGFHMAKVLKDDTERIKDFGINTVSVSVEYEFGKDGSLHYSWEGEGQLKSNIIRGKERGFAVLVAPNFVGPSGHNFAEEGIPMTLERYLQVSEEVALKWARIAEDYAVEFFAPQNEFDFMISQFTEGEVGTSEVTSNWHKEMLSKLKEVFAGKLIAKLSDTREGDNVSGYDYVGMTIFHRNTDLDSFHTYIKESYTTLAQVAKKSEASWLISEAWMPYGGPFYPETKNQAGQSLEELQDDYFKIATEEYLKITKNKPVGFIFIAWIMPGMDIKDRPAEQVLRDFYCKL